MSTDRNLPRVLALTAFLTYLAVDSPAQAGGFDVVGLIGGLGGLAQGAIQADLARQQIEFERQRLRDDESQRRRSAVHEPEPPLAAPLPSSVSGPIVYEADGLTLDRVLDTQTLSGKFKCVDSRRFSGLLSCLHKDGESGTVIYLNASSVVAYYGTYYDNIKITRAGLNNHLRKFSADFDSGPRIVAQDISNDGSYAILVAWGPIVMTRMPDQANQAALMGEVPGIYIEYRTGVDANGKDSKAIYHVEGGPGFYMTAFIDRTGRGRLRYGAYSASAFGTPSTSVVATAAPPPMPTPGLAATATPVSPPPSQPIAAFRPPVAAPAVSEGPGPSQPTLPSSPVEAQPAGVAGPTVQASLSAASFTAPPAAQLQPQDSSAVRPPVAPPAASKATAPSQILMPAIPVAALQVAEPLPIVQGPPRAAVPGIAMPAIPDQGRRVALVIGNAAYQSVARLDNPNGDAEAVAGALRAVGFASVKLVEDVTLAQMREALRDFQTQADDADWALVYYAGHGIEIAGQNYLIPVDAHLKTDQDADDEAVTLRYLLDKMHNARRLRLVILDACRENPFQGVMKRQVAARGVMRGLAPYEPRVANEMVVYAAKDGEQAQDGRSAGHSPFAKALVARLPTPGMEINKLFRLVTADVLLATNNQQQPFVYGSTPGEDDFYFLRR